MTDLTMVKIKSSSHAKQNKTLPEYDNDNGYEYDLGPPGGQGKLHKKIEDLLDGHLKKMYVDEKGV